jgi:hypothetical protein
MVEKKKENSFMRILIFFTAFTAIISACTKNTINEDTSGEVYQKYLGDYFATGTQIRYRVGIDTITYVDSFRMSISKYIDTTQDSTLLESQIIIHNFLGTGTNVKANASYYDIVPFTSGVLPNFNNIQMHSESKNIMNFSYNKVNGANDISRYSGKATRL